MSHLAYNLDMKKSYVFIFFLSVSAQASYLDDIRYLDETMLQEEAKTVDTPTPVNLAEKTRARKNKPVADLEEIYFEDQINTKAAAPVLENLKKRSR